MNLLDHLLAHWRSIPKSGLVPSLRDYLERPNPITQPWTLIIDIEDHGFPTRLFGTGLAELVGGDLTHTDHLLLFPEAQRARSLLRHKLLTSHPCGMESVAQAQTLKGLVAEMIGLALPLSRDDGGHSVVRVIQVTENLGYSDKVATVTAVDPKMQWIDIGYGVPDQI